MKIKNNFCGFLLIFFLFFGQIYAEKIYQLPEAYFRKDSVKIGEQIKLALIYQHPPQTEFLFPDSSYNFFPFEFVKKEFYPTKTDSLISTDSIVYTLTSFELEPILRLSLPVYVIDGRDSLPLYSDDAEVFLSEIITKSGTDSLRVNTQFKAMSGKLNYPYFLIGLGILLIITVIVFVFFRKKIIARYKSFLMRKDYEAYQKNFSKLQLEYESLHSTTTLELLLSVWKKYLQKLEKEPYTTLTTKEISKVFDYNQLSSSLQNFDRAIYGGYINENLSNSIAILLETATLRYHQKQKEQQNA
ncbi:MAG: hypothetical protein ACKVOU_14680 [Cytophagales bacterium]